MNREDRQRERATEEHAFRILEERNTAFRVLYDTVLAVEGAAEGEIFSILCRNLQKISQAAWTALASYDSHSGRLTFKVLHTNWNGEGITDIGCESSLSLSTDAVNDLRDVQIADCLEHNNCLVSYFPEAFHKIAKPVDEAACYRVSCVRERDLLAIGAIQVQPGQRLKMKDIVETYLNTAGMIIQRVNAVRALREHEGRLEELVMQRTAELTAANTALQESLETLKRTQHNLIQAEKMAALGRLVAGVAHEINTPVGIGVTAISHLEEKTRELEALYHENSMRRSDFERYLETVSQSANIIMGNLKRAAEQIQGFKLVAVDQTHEQKRVFNVKAYIREILLSLQPELKRAPYSVSVNCPGALTLDSYPGALSQVITNFIMNSLIHGFSPETPGEIILDVYQDEQGVWIRYHDTGKGMSDLECSQIFEPFYTTKRGQGGCGLGLHIVYNLVTQRMRGSITCESAPGKGTTFLICLPASSDNHTH